MIAVFAVIGDIFRIGNTKSFYSNAKKKNEWFFSLEENISFKNSLASWTLSIEKRLPTPHDTKACQKCIQL